MYYLVKAVQSRATMQRLRRSRAQRVSVTVLCVTETISRHCSKRLENGRTRSQLRARLFFGLLLFGIRFSKRPKNKRQ